LFTWFLISANITFWLALGLAKTQKYFLSITPAAAHPQGECTGELPETCPMITPLLI